MRTPQSLGKRAPASGNSLTVSALVYVALTVTVLGMLGLHALPEAVGRRIPHIDLTPSWRTNVEPSGKVTYRSSLAAPDFCKSPGELCRLVIGTLANPTEAYLNGTLIGRVGRFSPHVVYSQTYPASFPLVGLHFRGTNELLLVTEPVNRSIHGHANGMIRGPIGVFTSSGAQVIGEILVAETIVVPLVSALLMLLFGILACGMLRRKEIGTVPLRRYAAYCFSMAAYLASLTRLPREYLPLGSAYALHFSLRVLSEFFLIGLVIAFLPVPKRAEKFAVTFIRTAYFAYAVVLLLMIPCSVHAIYQAGTFGVDAFVFTYLLIIPLSLRNKGRYPYFPPLFISLALLQLWDTLALNGVVQDAYFVRTYPVPLALTFGYLLWDSGWKARRDREVATELGMVATQIAHDLRAPVGALHAASSSLGAAEGDLVRLATARIQSICAGLLDSYRAPPASSQRLQELIDPILLECRTTLDAKSARVKITSEYVEPTAAAVVDPDRFQRTISNLLNNSLEALPPEGGDVAVIIRGLTRHVEVEIKDTGKGIPAERLASIFERRGASGASTGNGFGLPAAREAAEHWKGELQIQSREGQGTSVRLRLPRS